ncbi:MULTISPECIES: DUF1501 domain-containing protein [unclassified Chelatococcus]|uniref:DUF1501 domain-containing protein n=1 Tax=unclassified Chelatococcus TaxID=2638111 RepID=UPI001BCAD4C3|nr:MULTISPECIES: DUF1501 domain-containing protein [unclassified Chelatococcus]MBS7697797.1 DUF1501 domain-containing protein [Chelatococcus sp. YT9]MBX3559736.1 DUF1501 domain-containing protein [Chelatococcus sp.]
MSEICETITPSRRAILGTAGALFGWSFMPRFAYAAGGRDVRFICIVLRGAMDGLAAVAPIGDPDYAGLHGDLALERGGPNPAIPLDGFFALHPAMPHFARLYGKGQAAVVHAVATAYRDRSHFDGQDVLESGQAGVGRTDSGWLNRLVAALPEGEAVARRGCLGVGAVAPLVVRGAAPVLGWAPPSLPPAGDDLARRLMDLYGQTDPVLAQALMRGVDTERLALASLGPTGKMGGRRGGPDTPQGMRQIAEGAARLLAADDGPRIAAMAFEGWDTHAREGGATGRLAQLLGGLDGAIAALETGLGQRWSDTVVMVVTEFGRTARINGTEGTDHGTGTVSFLAGGAIKGGRVIADWPGLKDSELYEGRDLLATTDLRAVTKGLLIDLFGVSATVLARDVFPESGLVKPMSGLIS